MNASVVLQITAEVQGLEQEVAATATRVAEQEQAQREASERVEEIQFVVDDLLERSRAQQDEFGRMRTTLAVKQQEAKALAQRAEQLRNQQHELEVQIGRRADRLKALHLQQEQLLAQLDEQDSALLGTRNRAAEQLESIRSLEQRLQELETQSAQLSKGQQTERHELVRLEVEEKRSAGETLRAREAIDALVQQVREEFGGDESEDPVQMILGSSDDDDESFGNLTN